MLGGWRRMGEGSCTRSNIESMSVGEIVDPSFAMKRKPWVEKAERMDCAVEEVGLVRDIIGMSDSDIVKRREKRY
jgi:hypothetical protein